MKALCPSAAAEEDRFANEDVAVEILSRLPIESVQQLSCVSKRWFGLFSSPYFATAHFQRALRTNPGLLVQGVKYCFCCRRVADCQDIDFISSSSAGEEGKHGSKSKKILEFLPEKKVSVVASSNGVVLCRNEVAKVESEDYHRKGCPKEVVLYVCNPVTKEWTSLSPKGKYRIGCCFGFAYDPFGSSCNSTSTSTSTSTYTGGSFQVVMIIPPGKLGQDPYCFNIYSSTTGRWRKSKQVCMLPHELYLHQSCYAGGVFYWMTTDDSHSILGFDIRRERCEVINLPGSMMQQNGKCMGVSQGKLQYVSLNMIELVIWELGNSEGTPNWVVRHTKPVIDMNHPIFSNLQWVFSESHSTHKETHMCAHPYALQDDMLYLVLGWSLVSYDVKTGKFEELCRPINLLHIGTFKLIPYCKTLLQVQIPGSAIAGRTK